MSVIHKLNHGLFIQDLYWIVYSINNLKNGSKEIF